MANESESKVVQENLGEAPFKAKECSRKERMSALSCKDKEGILKEKAEEISKRVKVLVLVKLLL